MYYYIVGHCEKNNFCSIIFVETEYNTAIDIFLHYIISKIIYYNYNLNMHIFYIAKCSISPENINGHMILNNCIERHSIIIEPKIGKLFVKSFNKIDDILLNLINIKVKLLQSTLTEIREKNPYISKWYTIETDYRLYNCYNRNNVYKYYKPQIDHNNVQKKFNDYCDKFNSYLSTNTKKSFYFIIF